MRDSQTPVRALVSFAPLALLSILSGSVLADGTGWFTADQTNLGRLAYAQRCATCHGAELQGTGAPALKGTAFNAQWNGKTLQEFYDYVHDQMPLGQGGVLKGQEYADIVAFILSQSGLPAGPLKLRASPGSSRSISSVLASNPTSLAGTS